MSQLLLPIDGFPEYKYECIDALDFSWKIQNESVKLIITSPPYNIGKSYETRTDIYERGDIDVGIEIIPMHSLMSQMSTGVAWYENELANIIREGRSNPSVPVILAGIEP